MIIFEEAQRIAEKYIRKIEIDIALELKLMSNKTMPYGWIFFYNSKEYIENKNFSAALAGNAPFLVSSHDGSLHVFGTAYPLEVYLQEYEKNLSALSVPSKHPE